MFTQQGGAPCNDGTGCPTLELTQVEVWGGEAYSIAGFHTNSSYTFSHCNGSTAGSWIPEYTVITPSGGIDAFGPGDGCSITWTASETGTYLIVVNKQDSCGTLVMVENGFPALTCNGNAPCDGIVPGLFWVIAQPFPSLSDSPNCNGSASVQVYFGDPPFQFSFSTGQTGSSSDISGLCPGLYSVDVTDANGLSVSVNFAIANFSSVLSDLAGLIDPSTDTLYSSSLLFCDLDYTLPIDSFLVSEVVQIGDDTLFAEWLVWQQGEQYLIGSFYPFSPEDSIALSLVVFCENGRSQLGVFHLYSLFTSSITHTSTNNQPLATTLIHPNPSRGLFNLFFSTPVLVKRVMVTDVMGRVVWHRSVEDSKEIEIDLRLRESGLYIVHCMIETGVQSYRIIKN